CDANDGRPLVFVLNEFLEIAGFSCFRLLSPIVHLLCSFLAFLYGGILGELCVTACKLLGVLQCMKRLTARTCERPDEGESQDPNDDQQGHARGRLSDWNVLTVIDEWQVVLAQCVQHELDADNTKNRRQTVTEVDQTVQQA